MILQINYYYLCSSVQRSTFNITSQAFLLNKIMTMRVTDFFKNVVICYNTIFFSYFSSCRGSWDVMYLYTINTLCFQVLNKLEYQKKNGEMLGFIYKYIFLVLSECRQSLLFTNIYLL